MKKHSRGPQRTTEKYLGYPLMPSTGALLMKARQRQGHSTNSLARQIHWDVTSVRNLERGVGGKVEAFAQLARLLDIAERDLLKALRKDMAIRMRSVYND